jgi:hypothetical protein
MKGLGFMALSVRWLTSKWALTLTASLGDSTASTSIQITNNIVNIRQCGPSNGLYRTWTWHPIPDSVKKTSQKYTNGQFTKLGPENCLQRTLEDQRVWLLRPRLNRIESIPSHAVPENDVKDKISGEDATKAILQADYAVPEVGIDETDALGISSGAPVSVEANE